jgi:hypothetical protein
MKLYVKATCFVCADKAQQCHACNSLGYNYIEASDISIALFLMKCDEQQKKIFIHSLQKDETT